MDANKLSFVLDSYESGAMDLVEASFQLIMLGCSAEEAIALLENCKSDDNNS